MPSRLPATVNMFAMVAQVGAGGAVGLIFPLAPLFIYLLMLMAFNFVIALGAVIVKPTVGYHEFLKTGVQRLMMLALAKFCYITDAHMGEVPNVIPLDVALGPLVTGWFIVHVAVRTLEACETADIPIGPLGKVLAILKAKEAEGVALDNSNPAAGGALPR